MRAPFKIAIVIAGYIAAALTADAVTSAYFGATNSGGGRHLSVGTYAFSEGLFFLGVFAGAVTLPSTAALIFLRPYRKFWLVWAAAALAAAMTAAAAAVIYATGWGGQPELAIEGLAAVAVIRLIVSPLVLLGALLSAMIAPARSPRRTLVVAAALEFVAFAIFAVISSMRA